MPFELLIVTKSDASELDIRQSQNGLLTAYNLVAENKCYAFQTVGKSVLGTAIHALNAGEVFGDWLDVFERLPDGQTITLWRVIANDDGSLFMHSFVGVIDNERLPRACKIDRKG